MGSSRILEVASGRRAGLRACLRLADVSTLHRITNRSICPAKSLDSSDGCAGPRAGRPPSTGWTGGRGLRERLPASMRPPGTGLSLAAAARCGDTDEGETQQARGRGLGNIDVEGAQTHIHPVDNNFHERGVTDDGAVPELDHASTARQNEGRRAQAGAGAERAGCGATTREGRRFLPADGFVQVERVEADVAGCEVVERIAAATPESDACFRRACGVEGLDHGIEREPRAYQRDEIAGPDRVLNVQHQRAASFCRARMRPDRQARSAGLDQAEGYHCSRRRA